MNNYKMHQFKITVEIYNMVSDLLEVVLNLRDKLNREKKRIYKIAELV